MSTLVLSDRDVRALLPMRECMDVVEDALRTLARGEAANPLRSIVRYSDGTGILGVMPALLDTPACGGIKVVSVTPGNHGGPYDAHQGAVLLFEKEHGRLLAVLDASAVTAIRTGAASGVATRALARPDASRLAILGSGVQAASHLEAMLAAREIRHVSVWSRSPDGARRFAERESPRHGVEIAVAPDARAAVSDADVVCTTTASPEPVLRGAWLRQGAHVNAAGACFPITREVDTEAVTRSRLFVDRRESALAESGDFLIPRGEGAINDDWIVGELGDVLLGRIPGRRSDEEITLFDSLGIGVEDVAVAHHVHAKARRDGVGTAIDLGGRRER